MRYRKKPVVIEAVQFTGVRFSDPLFGEEPPTWLRDAMDSAHDSEGAAWVEAGTGPVLSIFTSEGVMRAQADDWIIRGIMGEIYPCKPDIFTATYEPVLENQP